MQPRTCRLCDGLHLRITGQHQWQHRPTKELAAAARRGRAQLKLLLQELGKVQPAEAAGVMVRLLPDKVALRPRAG